MRPGRLFVALACAASLARSSAAQRAPAKPLPELYGVVLAADGGPVSGAEVSLVGLGVARTDSLGRFGFRGLPVGTFVVRVQRLGFGPIVQMVSYDGEHAQRVTLRFGSSATALAPVIVIDSAATRGAGGFEQRRRSGQGYYLSEREIAARHVRNVEQLFGQMPGVQVDSTGTVRVDRGRTSLLGDDCQRGMQLVVDGTAVDGTFSLRGLSPDALEGIEVYRSVAATPAELRTSRMACGTIAIWTK